MQTFMPYDNASKSAAALDNRRLNKQILEAYQILNVLSGNSPTGGWRNHPAVLMWKGSEYALFDYATTMITEAKRRGIKTDKNFSNIVNLEENFGFLWSADVPKWFKGKALKRIMATHKANLYLKDPIYYSEFEEALDDYDNDPCCPTCKYFWFTHELRKTQNN